MSYLTDGFSTQISFQNFPNLHFKEKEVQPPGMQGGGANDTTTMRNTRWRTKMPKKLIEMQDASLKVAYDPVMYQDCVSALQVNQQIVCLFPDGHNLTFWGWLDEFTPDSLKEGEQPTATIKIVCGNMNNSFVEVAPTYS
jgi:hypothetical protein